MSMRMHTRFAVLTLIVVAAASCASRERSQTKDWPMTATPPRIELLGFPDCPNTPELRASLTTALASIGTGWTFTDTNQEKLPEGDLRRGWPTPTILVNGRDLFGMPAPTAASMGCRMYAGGVPGASEIAAQLRASPSTR